MKNQPWLRSDNWQKFDPKLVELRNLPIKFPHTIYLSEKIDTKPAGIIIVRGPRQVGKSTFLREFAEKCLREGVSPESLVLFDAEAFRDRFELTGEIESFLQSRTDFKVILIDEIASLEKWWLGLKVLSDRGLLNDTLILCTGSSTQDLHEGADLLPGRRGRRFPVDFELLPVRYRDLYEYLTLREYMLTGGMPWAISEFLRNRIIPAHVYQLYGSWIEGAFLRSRFAVQHLPHLMNYVARRLCTPFAVLNLARDCEIGANATAESYLALLERIYALFPCRYADLHTNVPSAKKNRKFYPIDPFIVHLMAGFGHGWENAYDNGCKWLADSSAEGIMAETIVASELRFRSGSAPFYWLGKKEIDFTGKEFIEVKFQNSVNVTDFFWVLKTIPAGTVFTVLTKNTRATEANIRLIPLFEWLTGRAG